MPLAQRHWDLSAENSKRAVFESVHPVGGGGGGAGTTFGAGAGGGGGGKRRGRRDDG